MVLILGFEGWYVMIWRILYHHVFQVCDVEGKGRQSLTISKKCQVPFK